MVAAASGLTCLEDQYLLHIMHIPFSLNSFLWVGGGWRMQVLSKKRFCLLWEKHGFEWYLYTVMLSIYSLSVKRFLQTLEARCCSVCFNSP